MNIKQIEREQVLAEIIAERDSMIRNLVMENVRQAEKIKELETARGHDAIVSPTDKEG